MNRAADSAGPLPPCSWQIELDLTGRAWRPRGEGVLSHSGQLRLDHGHPLRVAAGRSVSSGPATPRSNPGPSPQRREDRVGVHTTAWRPARGAGLPLQIHPVDYLSRGEERDAGGGRHAAEAAQGPRLTQPQPMLATSRRRQRGEVVQLGLPPPGNGVNLGHLVICLQFNCCHLDDIGG